MGDVLTKGTLFPPEIVSEMVNTVKGKSVLAALVGARPVAFNGQKEFTFALDKEVDLVAENGATEMEDVTINGMSALSYVLEGTDTACVSFATEAGYILEFAGAPKSDEGFAAVLAFIMASIQPEE